MGNPTKKKKRDSSSSSSSSSSSDSNSDSDASSVKEKSKKQHSPSSDDNDEGKKQKDDKLDKISKEETNEKIKKHKYDDIQKSKWDSPAENIPKNERKLEKDTRRRYPDREDNREPRKHYERPKNERRDDYRKHDRDDERRHRDDGREEERRYRDDGREEERRYRDDGREEERRYKDDVRDDDRRYKDRPDRHNKDRGGRYDRRPNEERYRSDRRRSRDRSHSRDREDNRRDKREDFRHRKRPKFDNSEENENYDWGKKKNDEDKKPPGEKEKPNFGLSGKLTEDTNTYRGIVIKYSEPPEARKPKRRWRLYPFKGEKALPTLYIHRESAYLMGRERKVVDFPLDHPSCSKQHAVLQYRLVPFTRDNGTVGKRVRPYLIDLDSANGTYINNKRVEARKYYELLEKDVIKFGYSTREYVLLHENSKDEGLDDDVKQEEEEVPVKEEPQE